MTDAELIAYRADPTDPRSVAAAAEHGTKVYEPKVSPVAQIVFAAIEKADVTDPRSQAGVESLLVLAQQV